MKKNTNICTGVALAGMDPAHEGLHWMRRSWHIELPGLPGSCSKFLHPPAGHWSWWQENYWDYHECWTLILIPPLYCTWLKLCLKPYVASSNCLISPLAKERRHVMRKQFFVWLGFSTINLQAADSRPTQDGRNKTPPAPWTWYNWTFNCRPSSIRTWWCPSPSSSSQCPIPSQSTRRRAPAPGAKHLFFVFRNFPIPAAPRPRPRPDRSGDGCPVETGLDVCPRTWRGGWVGRTPWRPYDSRLLFFQLRTCKIILIKWVTEAYPTNMEV